MKSDPVGMLDHVEKKVREELAARPRELGFVSLGPGLWDQGVADDLADRLTLACGHPIGVVHGVYDHPDEIGCYYTEGPITETHWRNGLDTTALETYQTLRADGTGTDEALELTRVLGER